MIEAIILGLGIFVLMNVIGILIFYGMEWHDTWAKNKQDIIKCKWGKDNG
jgi:hypothetical protein|tara:strand:- start:122 stop:271 length:150 start_codon:yes stop_codon:yes gene_type:complete